MTTEVERAEHFLLRKPVGYSMDSGYEVLTRLDDLAGEPNFNMERPGGESWNGGITEAADFLVNALAWSSSDYDPTEWEDR